MLGGSDDLRINNEWTRGTDQYAPVWCILWADEIKSPVRIRDRRFDVDLDIVCNRNKARMSDHNDVARRYLTLCPKEALGLAAEKPGIYPVRGTGRNFV